jgi:glycosyltransferase involved in cell wall biosynthesis
MATIALNMIVKDEAAVIQRCLASVRPWIDTWTIVDTGSNDDTPALIEQSLRGIPGELCHQPWVDFGHNRSEAIALAGTRADYLLFIDADEELVMPPGFVWPDLTADAYSFNHHYGNLHYHRAALARARLPWRFEGVLHEYLACAQPHQIQRLEGPTILVRPEGSRSSDPHKYDKDAALLAETIKRDPGNHRHWFYLAQSYRDGGRLAEAHAAYQRRAAMGGWDEEVWYSLYQIARLKEVLGAPKPEVFQALIAAYEYRPSRPEGVGSLVRFCRMQGDHHTAHAYARVAMDLPPCQDALFLEPDWQRWMVDDEYGITCYWTGRYAEAVASCRRLLANPHLPDRERERVARNLSFAERAQVGGAA